MLRSFRSGKTCTGTQQRFRVRRFAGHRPGPEELVDSVAVDAVEVLEAEAGDESAVAVAVCLDLQRVDRGEVSGGEGRECDADASDDLFHGVFPP